MKIVVCVKQVPDTKGGVKFNPDGTLDRAAMQTHGLLPRHLQALSVTLTMI